MHGAFVHECIAVLVTLVEFYDQHLQFIRASYDRSYNASCVFFRRRRRRCFVVAFMRIYEL